MRAGIIIPILPVGKWRHRDIKPLSKSVWFSKKASQDLNKEVWFQSP